MIKQCKICNGNIETHKDEYCKLEDYTGDKKNSDGWYHKKCFFERIKSKAEQSTLLNKAAALLQRAEKGMVASGY